MQVPAINAYITHLFCVRQPNSNEQLIFHSQKRLPYSLQCIHTIIRRVFTQGLLAIKIWLYEKWLCVHQGIWGRPLVMSLKANHILPPFHKSRNALPQFMVTRLLGGFLPMTWRRHLQETNKPNQAFLLFWNGEVQKCLLQICYSGSISTDRRRIQSYRFMRGRAQSGINPLERWDTFVKSHNGLHFKFAGHFEMMLVSTDWVVAAAHFSTPLASEKSLT